ncbi:hypothetical protein BHE74_00027972 [Ensete ventricosum]|nr:hypothetical protein GW17_00061843 [Ensete ventricosum]RWW64772.1 hypothetical protein BHE74_00027972 [Ensete ventricosum]
MAVLAPPQLSLSETNTGAWAWHGSSSSAASASYARKRRGNLFPLFFFVSVAATAVAKVIYASATKAGLVFCGPSFKGGGLAWEKKKLPSKASTVPGESSKATKEKEQGKATDRHAVLSSSSTLTGPAAAAIPFPTRH